MESRVSSNCTRNINRPSPPEKEVNRKENTVGKIAKKATDSKVHASPNTGHGEFEFYKENRDLSSKILSLFLQWNFLRLAGPLHIFVSFLVLVDKKNHMAKIWVKGRKHKIANSAKK